VAGLEDITSGTLRMAARPSTTCPEGPQRGHGVPELRPVPAHDSGAEHRLCSEAAEVPKAEINTKVREAAQLLGLSDYLNSKPGQLSGGQRQRVAMGRAIVREPSVFLMDEPLSNLDAKLRVQMRAEISRIQRRVGVATLYVTHDQVEAMTMGDRVAVLHMGRLQQCDSPQSLYEHPDNLFVLLHRLAAMNLYEASISSDATQVKLGSQSLNLSEALLDAARLFAPTRTARSSSASAPSTSWTRHWDRCRRPAQP